MLSFHEPNNGFIRLIFGLYLSRINELFGSRDMIGAAIIKQTGHEDQIHNITTYNNPL